MVEYKNHNFEGPGGLTEWDYATGNAQLSTAQKHSGLQSFLSTATGTTACYVRDNVTYDEVYVNFGLDSVIYLGLLMESLHY